MERTAYIQIEWQAPFDVTHVSALMSQLETAILHEWRAAEMFAVRTLPYYPIDASEVVEMARQERWTDSVSHSNPNVDLRAVHFVYSHSPLSDTSVECSVWSTNGELSYMCKFFRPAFTGEGFPIDEEAARCAGGVLPDDDDWDYFWDEHYTPAWPTNARILMSQIDAIKDLFPLKSIEIPPQLAEPEKYAEMDLRYVLQLTNQPPAGYVRPDAGCPE